MERITSSIDEDNFTGLSKIEVTRKLYRAYSKLNKLEDVMERHDVEKAEDLERRLKALQILKEKRVNVRTIYHTDNVVEYNSEARRYYDCSLLTREEYVLLKEELK